MTLVATIRMISGLCASNDPGERRLENSEVVRWIELKSAEKKSVEEE